MRRLFSIPGGGGRGAGPWRSGLRGLTVGMLCLSCSSPAPDRPKHIVVPGEGSTTDSGGDTAVEQGDSGDTPEPEPCAALTVVAGQRVALTTDDVGPIVLPEQRGPGVALVDLDGDEDLDMVWALPSGPFRVYLNDGAGVLSQATVTLTDGGELPESIAVAAADIDGDGDEDLVLTRQTEHANLLLYNEGGLSFRVVELPDSGGESKTASFADVDGDGDLDLFTCGFSTDVHSMVSDTGFGPFDGPAGEGIFIYTQDGGSWTQSLDALPSAVFPSQCYQGSWLDVEGDGDLDLYLSNEAGAYFVPNQLLLNDGTGHFAMAPDCFCDLAIDGMGGAIGDANGDTLPDIYLTDAGSNHLLINQDGSSFVNSALALGAVPGREETGSSWGTQFVDLDQDGIEDLVTSYGWRILGEPDGGEGDVFLHADGDGRFTDMTAEIGLADGGTGRNMVVGDLDRDGRPDLVTGGVRDEEGGAYYWRSWFVRGGCEPGINMRFHGPHGFGPRVEVELPGGTRYYRWLEASTTYGSSPPELHLGLGGYAAASSINVHWLDGRVSSIETLTAGSTVRVRPPE